jgi:hypothetical protein
MDQTPKETRWDDALGALLAEERRLLDALRPLAQRQRDLARQGRAPALLEVLSERQRLIDLLLEADRDLGPLARRMAEGVDDLPARRRGQLKDLIEGINRDLAVVLDEDAQTQRLLGEAVRAARGEIQTADQARAARSAYADPGGGASRFADRRG